MKQDLINKLKDKTAIIGIVGLGYVGIPLAIRYAEVGYKVIGFDIDPEKAEKIQQAKPTSNTSRMKLSKVLLGKASKQRQIFQEQMKLMRSYCACQRHSIAIVNPI